MLFPTVGFALFFLPVFLTSWALHRWHVANKLFLVAASYVFYAAWDWRFCGLLFASSVGNHLVARFIDRTPGPGRRLALIGCIAANLGILGWFKYWGFFAASADDLLMSIGVGNVLPLMEVVLPVGISFFTFHAISYVVDVYRRQMAPARSLLDVLLYISFFPHLVAGPIVRASYFLPQLTHPVDRRAIKLTAAITLIVSGLVKKVLIADYLAGTLADPAFLDPQTQTAVGLWFGMYGYAVQIYCDFSGYTDMAIGIAALFGYRFPLNFNQPYRSVSLREFWTRWHISLSSWLRDYVYIPLGGNRSGPAQTCVNLLTTMMIGGLWHGANWTFLAWGGLHGAALVAGRLIPWRVPKALGWVVTFHVVCFAWVLFRSPDFATASAYFRGMVTLDLGPGTAVNWTAALVTVGCIASHFLPPDTHGLVTRAAARLHWSVLAGAAATACVLIAALGPDGIPPFIYFAF